MNVSETRQSSIMVAVRVRPFSSEEAARLIKDENDHNNYPSMNDSLLTLPNVDNNNTMTDKNESVTKKYLLKRNAIRKIVDCVDDKMLIFDPADTNPLNKLSDNVLNAMYSKRQTGRRNLRRGGGELKFVFDKLFDETANQTNVYNSTTSSLLDSVLDGFNGTVFAYGATGCGKTFTISGTPEQPGIIFLTMDELFKRIESLKDTKNIELTLSYLEIYNETIRDLLNPNVSSKKLVIREDSDQKITVSNLSHHKPQTVQEVMDFVIRGNMNRTTSPTDANETSSRSHAVLQIHIAQTDRTPDLISNSTFATLSIIDLAGSERAASTKNRGERLIEGANINKSLLALGNCINALCISDGTRRTCHVPYRDSKLTRLLKFSLGGNCKTVMIVCISPSSTHYDETLNTLTYANRAKDIKTKIIRNQQSLNRHVGSYLKMITEQKKEIQELRHRENNMIDLHLKKYKLGREKVELAIEDCIQKIKNSLLQTPKFQNTRIIKSLILCKRRLLQLVNLEISEVLEAVEDWTDVAIVENCRIIQEQLNKKTKELEEQFDTPAELEIIIENAKTIEKQRLSEMEFWDPANDAYNFDIKLNYIAELIRNDILVKASMFTESLFENRKLISKFKFLSKCLSSKQDIHECLKDLLDIDKEFDIFGKELMSYENSNITGFSDFENRISKANDYTKTSIVSEANNVPPVNITNLKNSPTVANKIVTHNNSETPPSISKFPNKLKYNKYSSPLSEKKKITAAKRISKNENGGNSNSNSPSPKNINKIKNPILSFKEGASNINVNSSKNNVLNIHNSVMTKPFNLKSRMSLDPQDSTFGEPDVSMQDIYPNNKSSNLFHSENE
ncbi:hypothetical protein TPHA_0D03480 [Tetrapisispora phaffii CBS 4417]|uniref:Kinesin-like protein n=1 Tax=Tetrapisispora phaffii (strain ATCC 24235 / CBS 4417 / NBRC 1672 / NRRL Y-8282 / UCD 70-5) TaxID=1071381 RepID=G8BT12_TETPH|nr:hypothetical protein TPHA_0D03480 [Tetrapisispora phaffii CBS 4417]CCE62983.1 hypothetical protein TPHA_0D03480 [Tetrapisispora phaffii CBS 4417]